MCLYVGNHDRRTLSLSGFTQPLTLNLFLSIFHIKHDKTSICSNLQLRRLSIYKIIYNNFQKHRQLSETLIGKYYKYYKGFDDSVETRTVQQFQKFINLKHINQEI